MDGILDKKYSDERKKKKYLSFRYKQRALVASHYINKYLGDNKIKDDLNILDFGAAEGLTLIEISKILKVGNFTGIEYDQSLIDSAPELPPNVKLKRGSVTNLEEIRDNSIDVVTALALMEHLEDPLAAMNEAKRILKPRGIFIATSPVPFWDKMSDKVLSKNKFGGENHLVDLNKKKFMELSKKSGLSLKEYIKFMWAPIATIPYFNIDVPVNFAWQFDKAVGKLIFLNFLFVNQCAVFTKDNN